MNLVDQAQVDDVNTLSAIHSHGLEGGSSEIVLTGLWFYVYYMFIYLLVTLRLSFVTNNSDW